MLLRPYLFSVSVDAGHVHGLFSCFLVPRWLALLVQFEDSEEDFDSRFDTDDELSYRRDSVYSCVTLPYFHSFLYMKGGSCGHPAPGSGTSPGPCPSPRARSSWRDGAGDRVLPGRTSPSPPSAGAVLGQGLRPLPPSSVPTLSVVSPLPNPPPPHAHVSLSFSHVHHTTRTCAAAGVGAAPCNGQLRRPLPGSVREPRRTFRMWRKGKRGEGHACAGGTSRLPHA